VSRCLDPAALALVLRGEAPAEDIGHASACAHCSKRVHLVQQIVEEHRGDAALAFRHVRLADHVRRRDATRTVDALTAEPVHRWPLIARSDDAVASNAVLGELFRRALASIYSEPHRARAFASAGLEVLRRLRDLNAVSAESEAGAYPDAAVVEKICGSTDAALTLLDKAKLAADRCADAEYELALVEIRRARWYVDPDSTIEGDACGIADGCEPVFQRRGDGRHVLIARLTKGAALLNGGDPAGAAAVYRRVVSEPGTPKLELAFACDALSASLVRLGEPEEALQASLRALDILNEMNLAVAAANSMCRLANAYDALGQHSEALNAIDTAIPVLQNADKLDACIRAELARVRITLHARPAADVAGACADIASKSMRLDASQRNRRRIATAEALAYLRDAAARRILSAALVEHVDAYIVSLDEGRFARFTPPVPPLLM